jgi:hypothetical protein
VVSDLCRWRERLLVQREGNERDDWGRHLRDHMRGDVGD